MTNNCNRPKTKAEVALEAIKIIIKFLDNNKLESVIFITLFGIALITVSISPEQLTKLIALW
jgi:hypothetical protein